MPTISIRVNSTFDDIMPQNTGELYFDTFIGFGSTGSGNYRDMGLKFKNIPIYQASKINSAKITFKAFATQSTNNCNIRVSANLSPDAKSFISGYEGGIADFNGRILTTNKVDVTLPGWIIESDYEITGLETIVQEIVDQQDWGFGNSIAFLLKNNSSSDTARRSAYSFDNDQSKAPILTIDYDDPPGIETTKDYGFRVSKDGFDVKTCEDKDLVITSKSNSFKIPIELRANQTLSLSPKEIKTTQIDHNLGYIPAFEAWYEDENGLWRTATAISPYNLAPVHNEVVAYVDSVSDEVNLLKIRTLNDHASVSYTTSLYYLIFIDQA